MIDYDFVYNQVYDVHILHANDVILLRKPTAQVQDLYREDVVTYDEGVELVCIVRTDPDEDMIGIIGKAEKDDIKITVTRKEVDIKLPSGDISVRDIIVFEDMSYSIHEVKKTARVGGDFTVFVICAKENPDLLNV